MKQNTTISIFICLIIIFLTNCKKDDPPSDALGINYIPLKVGSYHIYDVEKIVYQPDYTYTNSDFYPGPDYVDTLHYQLKEELYDIQEDLEGNEYYTIKRFIRENDSDSWQIDSLWKCQINGNNFIRVENNVSFIKLNFPVEINRSWDGNALNIYSNENCNSYHYSKFEPFVNDYLSVDNAVKVVMCDDTLDKIDNHNMHIEYYGENIGLLEKQFENYYYCNPPSDTTQEYNCVGLEIIDNGQKLHQTLIEYKIGG